MSSAAASNQEGKFIPGQYFLKEEPIEANVGRETKPLLVKNRGDRPIQVGSHCHFFEANRYLDFDREAAYGMRLNIPAGTAVRFEPGDSREVELVALAGCRMLYGINGLVNGTLDDPRVKQESLKRVAAFVNKEEA